MCRNTLVAALVLATVATAGTVAPAARAASDEYRLSPRDLVDVKVFEVPDLNGERRVSDAGTLSLPMVGDVPAAGQTTGELRERIAKLLTAKYVQHANVSVSVKEFGGSPVSVLGAVQKPGALPVSGQFTLLAAISAAGGLTPEAGRRIFVIRQAKGGASDTLEIPVEGLLRGETARWNIPIHPSDVINIPARTTVKVFCLGEVKSPGALEFVADDRISLLSVVARAGGLTDRASSKVRIRHRGPDGRDVETLANVSRIVKGKDDDPRLSPDDVVIVNESFF